MHKIYFNTRAGSQLLFIVELFLTMRYKFMTFSSNTLNITSENSNTYLYNAASGSFLISHPIMHYISKLDMDKEKYLNIIQRDQNNLVQIPGYHPITIDTLNYYIKKYKILQNSGYFEKKLISKEKISGRLSTAKVKNSFGNTTHINIEVTEKCNLKCEYCGYGDLYNGYDENRSNSIDFRKIKNLFLELEKYWESEDPLLSDKTIMITFYGGEPLLKMDIIKETINFLKRYKNKKFIFAMTTNGMLLDLYIDFLVKNDFKLLISLDGNRYANSYRVSHDGKESFDQVIKNIFLLKNRYPDYFNKKISFNSVFTGRNNYSSFIKFFRKNFNKKSGMQEVSTDSLRPEKMDDFNNIFGNSYNSFKKNEKYLNSKVDFHIDNPELLQMNDFIFKNTEFIVRRFSNLLEDGDYDGNKNTVKYFPSGTCIPFSLKLFITSRGKVLPCERIDFKHYLFQINNDVSEIDFNKVTKIYNDYFDGIQDLCAKCFNSSRCMKCIFNMDFNENKIHCDTFVSINEHSNNLSACFDLLEERPYLYNKAFEEVSLV